MHAFLIIGKDDSKVKDKILSISKKENIELIDFPIEKISDIRDLNSLLRLKAKKPTGYIIYSIDKATLQSQNAFLKNLEEPQENVYFFLTSSNENNLIPTIVSRCQTIYISDKISDKIEYGKKTTKSGSKRLEETNESMAKFDSLSVGKKLVYIDKLRNKEEAINFTNDLLTFFHNSMVKERVALPLVAKKIKAVQSANWAINKNGNVTLHLTKMVINI